MRALQYRSVGARPELVTLPDPEPGPGQILLRVTAVGVCHSDIAVMAMSAEELPWPLPFTLGHEGTGTVAALGAGVTGLGIGDAVAVYGPQGCGTCAKCAQGKENYPSTSPAPGPSKSTSRPTRWTRRPARTSACTPAR
jgi:alcohol dehydrogenase, propanol-preferring